MSPDFVTSSSLVSGTVTAHTSHFWAAILNFLSLLPHCLLPRQQSSTSSTSIPPPCSNSSSMHPSAPVSSSSIVCSSLYSPMSNIPCTHSSISSETPVISQVLQPLPHIHLVPIHQVPSPNFTWKWVPSGCLPHAPSSKEPSGTLRYFTGTCFPKPPFLLLLECEEGLHYRTVGMSFLFPLPQLPSSHYTCRESSSIWDCLLFVQPAHEWLETKTLQYIKH